MPVRLKGDAKAKIAAEQVALHRAAPREHGGNCDIKQICRARSKIYFIAGLCSRRRSFLATMGDLHFSAGRSAKSPFCGAIEMAGWLHLKVDIIKDGVSRKYGIKNPVFKPSPITPSTTSARTT